MKRIIIDSSSLIYAAFYTTGNLSYDGRETGIIYGFLRKIIKIAEKFKTNKFYFCFDHPINHRAIDYPLYKENRANRKIEMTEHEKKERIIRIGQAEEIRKRTLKNLGFRNIYRQKGFESDDLMAILAKKLKNAFIVTSDNDLFQCLDYCSIIDPKKLKVFTKEDFTKKYNVEPSQWSICKSIGGCTGDNVIGIKGAADPKSPSSQAIKYVNGEIKKGVLYDRIISKDGQNTIKRNYSLVVLPYPHKEARNLRIRKNKITKSKLIEVFSKYGFKSMLEKEEFEKWEKVFL